MGGKGGEGKKKGCTESYTRSTRKERKRARKEREGTEEGENKTNKEYRLTRAQAAGRQTQAGGKEDTSSKQVAKPRQLAVYVLKHVTQGEKDLGGVVTRREQEKEVNGYTEEKKGIRESNRKKRIEEKKSTK